MHVSMREAHVYIYVASISIADGLIFNLLLAMMGVSILNKLMAKSFQSAVQLLRFIFSTYSYDNVPVQMYFIGIHGSKTFILKSYGSNVLPPCV